VNYTGAILHTRASSLDMCLSEHQAVMVFRQQVYSTLPFQTPSIGVDLPLVGLLEIVCYNNNYTNNFLQLGCYLVVVVILYVYKT